MRPMRFLVSFLLLPSVLFSAQPNVLVIIETPVPTNTPQIYIVESGDTISEIAEKFKIPQADLIAANPDVNPNTLTIAED